MAATTFALCGLFLLVAFAPVLGRSKVGHNNIEAYATRYDKWTARGRPMISFDQGCMSYPAVAPNGDYSGGLKPTGSPGGSCRTSRFQQTYTRARWFTRSERAGKFRGARVAIMYANFFPKDQGSRQGLFGKAGGHRYDWEEVVVFLNDKGSAIRASTSAHGGYISVRRSGRHAKYWSGNRIKVKYGLMPKEFRNTLKKFFSEPFKNNGFFFTTKSSSNRPKEACWYYMPKKMRDSITAVNWGKASPKIVDRVFNSKIQQAWRSPLI
eukprot:IDg11206t1